MSTYLAYFKTRLVIELQYRVQAIAGIATQYFWGFLQIFIYQAFYESSPSNNLPMNFKELVAYIWLMQSFFALIYVRVKDEEISETIRTGTLAYELCRPYNLYTWWFVKILAKKYAATILRCLPILVLAFVLPEPYKLMAPTSFENSILFVISLLLGSTILISIAMLIQIISIFTLNDKGVISILNTIMELLSGLVIPLPLLPELFKKITYYMPFGLISDLPFRVYSGNILTNEAGKLILFQIVWLILLITLGNMLAKKALKKAYMQGG